MCGTTGQVKEAEGTHLHLGCPSGQLASVNRFRAQRCSARGLPHQPAHLRFFPFISGPALLLVDAAGRQAGPERKEIQYQIRRAAQGYGPRYSGLIVAHSPLRVGSPLQYKMKYSMFFF
jgi:hypothetical protein